MERRGHVAKGGGSLAFRLVAAARALANQLSLPICRAQFPSPSLSPEPVVPRRLGLLRNSRERARGLLSRQERLLCDPMGLRGSCRGLAPRLSEAGGVCLCAGGFSGDLVAVTFVPRHTEKLFYSFCSGHPVHPVCLKTKLEPLAGGEPGRWSPEAPPPLSSQGADWPASQPVPHHAPRESSSA